MLFTYSVIIFPHIVSEKFCVFSMLKISTFSFNHSSGNGDDCIYVYMFKIRSFSSSSLLYFVYVSISSKKSLSSVIYFSSNKSSNISCFRSKISVLSAILTFADISI